MPPGPDPAPEPGQARIRWPSATRIIASRYPPIDLFERVHQDPAVWDALIAAEMLTNPRIRDAIGEITLIPPEDRISGPGASYAKIDERTTFESFVGRIFRSIRTLGWRRECPSFILLRHVASM